jgi:cell division protein FtsI/penicillin-binding protein 2
MTAQLNRLAILLGAGFLAVALATGFWQVVRGADLLQRGDNPRRALLERRVPRGLILDRNGLVLADRAGQPGAWVRHYPYPALAPVLGYVSPLVGATGIEAALDPVLHGDAGLDPFTIYWRTSVLGVPPPGRDVRLTIDLAVQQVADTALGAHTGALVLLDAQSGDVLALASHPTFDANDLDGHWTAVVNNPASPLLNRATLALYQPGGAIEPVIVAGALQARLATAQQTFAAADMPVTFDGQSLTCRTPPAQSDLSLTAALALGCPAPTAGLGLSLGAADLARLFTQFQFFAAPSLSIPTTAPTADQAAIFTNTALAGIGQAGLTVTPLQMALVTAALARHGQMPMPRLVLQTQNAAGGWVSPPAAAPAAPIIDPAIVDQVKAMLPDGLQATAITNSGGKSLAWYLGQSPFDDPRYVVVVLLEDGDPRSAKDIGDTVMQAAH